MLEESVIDGIKVLTDTEARADGVLVAFTGRTGGVSRPPYDSLNLAATVGDDPSAVETNRSKVASLIGISTGDLVLARQVHGRGVIEARPGVTGVVGEADVLVSRSAGIVVGILTADCVPVILHGRDAVAVAHAGWRGLVAGAIDAAIERVGPVSKAWVGPSIHACCYEVGVEVVEAFRAKGLPVADASHVDPGRAAVAVLERAGIGNVESTTACTSCDDGYFSYRSDGATGRQAAFAGLIAR